MKRHFLVKFSCCVLVALIFLLLSPFCAAQVYKITKLPTLGGKARPRNANFAFGINSSGQVAGCSPTSEVNVPHIFLWTPASGIQDLGVECYGWQWGPGELEVGQGGLNDLGHVTSDIDEGSPEGFLWSASGGFQDLGIDVYPAGVNNLDQVAGSFNIFGNDHAFFWTSGMTMPKDLGTLGGNDSFAFGINDAGQVVGVSETAKGMGAAFLWSESTGMQGLPSPFGSAYAINNQGVVVGETASEHAGLWTQTGGVQDLGVLPGTTSSIAVALNNRRVVVGNSWYSQPGFAFLWSSSQGMLNLNVFGKNKLQNWVPVGINDAGQIAINRTDGQLLVLTPIIGIAVSSSQNPSQVGQLVTFTATTNSIAGPPPDGEVITFMDSGTVLGTAALAGGSASYSTSSLSAGTHKITATYPGDINYAGSQSKVLKQVVQ